MDFDKLIALTGVAVVTGILPHGWWGAYDWRTHTVTLRPGLGVVQHGSVLAHELGHAWYRHRGSTPRQERQAREWAARRLIRSHEFIDALRVSEHIPGIAQILGVMPSDVDTYISILTDDEIQTIRNLIAKEEAC